MQSKKKYVKDIHIIYNCYRHIINFILTKLAVFFLTSRYLVNCQLLFGTLPYVTIRLNDKSEITESYITIKIQEQIV